MLRKTACTALMAALAAGSAGGCTYMPAAGPTASAIQAGAEVATADGGILARYEIIDVTPSVVEALRGRPLDSLLASFGDHRPSSEPVIGIGDMVSVSVWEAGSGGLFSGPLVADRFSAGSKSALIPEQPVGRDGAISVPYAGRIKVAGRRTQDVQALIENELAGKAIQPQVLVSVTRPISQAVTVTGEGAAGARLPLSGHGDRILDVIAAAGGNRAPVNETFVRLSRGPVTATVPLTTVGNRAPVNETFVRLSRGPVTATVPLTTVVSNPRENIYLRPNDVLTLVRDPQTFIAVGALGNSTELPFQADGITLAQALAKARGLSDFAADPAGTFIFRFEPASVVRRLSPGSKLLGTPLVPVVYRIDMRDPNSLFVSQAFRMRNRDLIYVSNAPFTEVQKVLTAFNGVTGPVASAATAYAYAK
ncbi:polysaccharide biosynthesis/export family protein [Methylobacterium oryzae]|uniref:polysaccharide biosynthesis/export family protein n=1 Tax=Methylobacterium oryzae TaxID=334852 RepID=UPI002F35E7BA